MRRGDDEDPAPPSWDPAASANGLRFSGDNLETVTVEANDDGWHTAKSTQSYSRGRLRFELYVHVDARTSNTWRMVFGCVPLDFKCRQRQHTCVGSSQGGWGYVSGTGHRYRKAASIDLPYSMGFTASDRIAMELDFHASTIAFFKNGQPLGIAFRDLIGPVQLAICMTGKNSSVSIALASAQKESTGSYLSIKSSLNEDDRIMHLRQAFYNKFAGRRIDLEQKFWADPLSELTLMGFQRTDALEALLVTGSTDQLPVQSAVEYLFAASEDKAVRFQRAAEQSAALGTPPTLDELSEQKSEVEQLRAQIEQLKQAHAAEKQRLEREVYKTAVSAMLADGVVNRDELVRINQLQKERNITKHMHTRILVELGVSSKDFEAMKQKGKELEEKQRMVEGALRRDEERECVVCLGAQGDHVLLDCMHVCICETCAPLYRNKKAPECPKCRKPVREVRKVFL